MNRKQAWNLITWFLLMIGIFTVATILSPKSTYSERENKTLQQFPELNIASVTDGSFEKKYETYLSDQFVLRNSWIGLKTAVSRLAGNQDINDVYFASDGYLIEKHTGTFEAEQAEKNIQYLASFAEKVSGQFDPGHFTVMIVPNAVDILSDKLPAFASPCNEEEYLSRIRDSLPDGVWFDAAPILSSHKEEEIYYRTDHHWKTLGAFYVFEQWIKETGLGEISASDYTVTSVTDSFEGTIASKVNTTVRDDSIERYDSDLSVPYVLTYNQGDDIRHSVYDEAALDTKSKYDYFYGGNDALVEAASDAGTGRRLLVIKDSYAHCFVPFTYDFFDEVDMIDLRYFNQSLEEYMKTGGYTDLLILYNAAGFAEDTSLAKLTI